MRKFLYITGITFSIVGGIIFFRDVIFREFAISREHEREADEYVVKNGIEAEVLISALRKIAYLNDEPESSSETYEKLSTHPALVNRIKHITEIERT